MMRPVLSSLEKWDSDITFRVSIWSRILGITGLKWVYPDWEDYVLGIPLIMLPVSKYSPMSVSINCWTQMCIKDERFFKFSRPDMRRSSLLTFCVCFFALCLCTTFLAVALYLSCHVIHHAQSFRWLLIWSNTFFLSSVSILWDCI